MNPGDTRTLTVAVARRSNGKLVAAPKWTVITLLERVPPSINCPDEYMWLASCGIGELRIGASRMARVSLPGVVERPRCKCGKPLTGKQRRYCSPECGNYYAHKFTPASYYPPDLDRFPVIRNPEIYHTGPPIAGVY